MASFHLIVTARARLSPLFAAVAYPTLLSNTIKLGRTGSCDEMILGRVTRVRTFHWTIWIHLFRRAYDKVYLVQNLCLRFRRVRIVHRNIPYIVGLHLPCTSSLRCVRCVVKKPLIRGYLRSLEMISFDRSYMYELTSY